MAGNSKKAELAKARDERIAQQMRENLKKRKAQKKARNQPVQKEEDI